MSEAPKTVSLTPETQRRIAAEPAYWDGTVDSDSDNAIAITDFLARLHRASNGEAV